MNGDAAYKHGLGGSMAGFDPLLVSCACVLVLPHEPMFEGSEGMHELSN